eukprot:363267-Chlamydomonas_euryale.AAC.2
MQANHETGKKKLRVHCDPIAWSPVKAASLIPTISCTRHLQRIEKEQMLQERFWAQQAQLQTSPRSPKSRTCDERSRVGAAPSVARTGTTMVRRMCEGLWSACFSLYASGSCGATDLPHDTVAHGRCCVFSAPVLALQQLSPSADALVDRLSALEDQLRAERGARQKVGAPVRVDGHSRGFRIPTNTCTLQHKFWGQPCVFTTCVDRPAGRRCLPAKCLTATVGRGGHAVEDFFFVVVHWFEAWNTTYHCLSS